MDDPSIDNPLPASRKPKRPLADSPWFWVLLFSGMALVALLAIGPKYGGRQSRIERQYQARQRIAEQQIATDHAVVERATDKAGQRDFASAENTLIPLWPLALVLSGVIALAVVMIYRQLGAGDPLEQDRLAQ